jgi:hypothetical protein
VNLRSLSHMVSFDMVSNIFQAKPRASLPSSISTPSPIRSSAISARPYGTARMNVYYTTGKIGTSLDHPRQGSTQLFRRNCDMRAVEEIFDSSRVHTNRGYKRRCDAPAPLGAVEPPGRDSRRCRGAGGDPAAEAAGTSQPCPPRHPKVLCFQHRLLT